MSTSVPLLLPLCQVSRGCTRSLSYSRDLYQKSELLYGSLSELLLTCGEIPTALKCPYGIPALLMIRRRCLFLDLRRCLWGYFFCIG